MGVATSIVNLYYRQGNSDKVYNVWIEVESGNRYSVKYSYGRRGNTLTYGTKVANVGQIAAQLQASNLIEEKINKGYQRVANLSPVGNTTGVSVSPATTSSTERKIGILPQLLNPIEDDKLEYYLKSDDWWVQEKKDGKNIIVKKANNIIEIANRQGKIIPCPAELMADLEKLPFNSFVLCGELCGTKYYIFDNLELDGEDLKTRPYYYRFNNLDLIDDKIQENKSENLEIVSACEGTYSKRAELKRLKELGCEGIVFKNRNAVYTQGRPNSAGDQVKYKFVQSTTCIVASQNGSKRSVSLNMHDGDSLVTVGSVTILPNFSIPKIGALVEVRYLYAYRGGSLYQPVYLGERDDLQSADDIFQLKYRQESSEEDDG